MQEASRILICKYTGKICICGEFCSLQASEESWDMEKTAERLALLIENYVNDTPGTWEEKKAELEKYIDPATLEEFVSWMD